MQKYIRPSPKLQRAHLEFPLLNPLSRKTLLSQGSERCNKAAKVIFYGFKRFPARHSPLLGESPKAKRILKRWGVRPGTYLGIQGESTLPSSFPLQQGAAGGGQSSQRKPCSKCPFFHKTAEYFSTLNTPKPHLCLHGINGDLKFLAHVALGRTR